MREIRAFVFVAGAAIIVAAVGAALHPRRARGRGGRRWSTMSAAPAQEDGTQQAARDGGRRQTTTSATPADDSSSDQEDDRRARLGRRRWSTSTTPPRFAHWGRDGRRCRSAPAPTRRTSFHQEGAAARQARGGRILPMSTTTLVHAGSSDQEDGSRRPLPVASPSNTDNSTNNKPSQGDSEEMEAKEDMAEVTESDHNSGGSDGGGNGDEVENVSEDAHNDAEEETVRPWKVLMESRPFDNSVEIGITQQNNYMADTMLRMVEREEQEEEEEEEEFADNDSNSSGNE